MYPNSFLKNDALGNFNGIFRSDLVKTNGNWALQNIDDNAYFYQNPLSSKISSILDYTGNQLGYKANSGTYAYDLNGNTTYDPANKISTVYNYLNLPSKFTKDDGSKQELVYDFSGKKWQINELDITNNQLSNRSYLGAFEFEGNSLNLVHHGRGFIKNLKSDEYQTGTQNGNIQGASIVSTQNIGEGKYEAENTICLLPGFKSIPNEKFSATITDLKTQYQWQYALSDHLGNLRVLFTDKNNDGLVSQNSDNDLNEVLSFRNYSPYGLELGGSHKNLDYQNGYKFSSKELSNFTGLTDFGRRNFDAPLGRFTSQDRFSEKYFSLSSMGYAAGNPINLVDINGDSLDVSGLSKVQLEIFNSQISLLKQSKLFSAYYNALSESKTIYKISAQKGKAGTPYAMGQFFKPNTNEVGFGEKLDAYVVAQELFHAFQKDGEFYKNDSPSPLSTIEAEGDILSQYVMMDAGLPFPAYGTWSNEFQKDSYEGIPSIDKVTSSEYQQMFQKAVDNRIKYYINSGMNVPTYTAPNTGVRPKAFEAVIRKIN